MTNKHLIDRVRGLVLASAIIASNTPFGASYKSIYAEKRESPKQTLEIMAEEPDSNRDVEQTIERKFQEYFKSYSIDGKNITLNMPFGQNGERSKNMGYEQRISYDGKGDPKDLWNVVDKVVKTGRFNTYISELKAPEEKVVVFDLKTQKYNISKDKKLISQMRNGKYPGNDSLVYVYKKDGSLGEEDVYNYLYCLSSVGSDCAGFVYNIQKAIAYEKGINLDEILAKKWGVRQDKLPIYVGERFYNPEYGCTERIDDKISNIRAGDVISFRGNDGKIKHYAVIQSVDMEKGEIRYFQCTDWALPEERGVHESLIKFNPENPNASLKDKSLIWTQEIQPTFKGEEVVCWKTDKDRYRAYPEYGGSVIVRLKLDRPRRNL